MKLTPSRFVILLLGLPLLAVGTAVCAVAVSFAMSGHFSGMFEQIKAGATRDQVVVALGEPSKIRACGENLWWGNDAHFLGRNEGQCKTEDRYEYFLVAFGIGYSADQKVVSKYEYVSE